MSSIKLNAVPNIEPIVPKMTRLQFFIKFHLEHDSSSGRIAKSNNAGVMIDNTDIQIAPDKDINKSKSGTNIAIPSVIYIDNQKVILY